MARENSRKVSADSAVEWVILNLISYPAPILIAVSRKHFSSSSIWNHDVIQLFSSDFLITKIEMNSF